MLGQIRAALAALFALTVLTGIAYPLLITGIAGQPFPTRRAAA